MIDYSVPIACKMEICSGNLFASVVMFITDLSKRGPLIPSLLKELQRVISFFLKYPNNNPLSPKRKLAKEPATVCSKHTQQVFQAELCSLLHSYVDVLVTLGSQNVTIWKKDL